MQMQKVAMISPPYVTNYMRNGRCDFVSLSGTQWYPLWLGYLGAFLESRGYIVKLIDAPSQGLDHAAAKRACIMFNPDFVVIYSGRLSEDNDVAFVEDLLLTLNIPGAYVGPFASIAPEKLVVKSPSMPRAVSGEFELAVLDLLQGRADSEIANLVYVDGDNVISNARRTSMTGEELDAIPFITEFFSRHLNLNNYRTPSELFPFMDLMTGRGCAWGRCTYCLWVHTFIKGSTYNTRSVENVVDEFLYVQKHLPQVRSIMIQDDTFTEKRAVELCEAFVRRRVKLPWSCYARGNQSYETLILMKRAGCRNLHVGFESENAGILKTIKKGLTMERMSRFAEDANKAGLRLHGDFAIGFPGETRESVERTLDWAISMRPHTAQFQLMIPFPGTPFYDQLVEQGHIKDGCASYPDLDADEMERLAKKAYRKYYLSSWFAGQVLAHPKELFVDKLGTYISAIPSILWKKYVR